MKQELLEQFNKETEITKPVDTDLDYYQSQYITWLEHQIVNKNDLLQRVRQQSELFVSFARFVANYKHSYATSYDDMFKEWCDKRNI